MSFLLVQALSGLATAATLFLVSSGLTIVFGVTRIVNFAHGSFYMVGAYAGWSLIERFGGTPAGFWGSVAAAITKAKSANAEPIVDALAGLTIDSPVGPVTFRASDHQATMGAYVGTTTVKDGRGTMKDWRYADGANYLPPDDAARKMRPAE